MDTGKILSLLVMLSVLSQSFVVYGADTESDFNDTRTRVLDVQAENSSLPTTLPVDERKGSIGYIMSRLFDSQGRIGNWYIKAFKDVENNAILRWSGAKNGMFATGSLYDTGTRVGIGDSTPDFDFDVEGDINFTGDFYRNGTLVNFAGKFSDGTNPLNAVYMDGDVGIGTLTPAEALSVVGRLSVTQDPNSDDDVGDRGYNDTRYLNVGEKASDTNLLDGLDSTAFVRTTTNQTIGGTKTFSSLIGGSIDGNAVTATRLQTSRNIAVSGDVTGSASFNGSANISIATTLAADSVDSSNISNGSIVNVDVNNAAAIAGTKISPNFGNQAVTTQGNYTVGNSSGYRVGGVGDTFVGELQNISGVLSLTADTNRNIQIGDADTPSALFVKKDGNVGVGTANPGYPLDVVGDIRVSETILASEVLIDGERALAENNIIQPFNGFGNGGNTPKQFYASHLTDRFFGRSSELYVTVDGTEISDSQKNQMFDGNFGSNYNIAPNGGSSVVLNINTVTNGLTNSNGITYAQGVLKLAFYPGRHPESTPTARWKDKDGTYRNLTVSQDYTSGSDYLGYEITGLSGIYLTDLEITLTPQQSGVNDLWITTVEYHGSRMGLTEGGLLTANGGTFYNSLNAKFEGTETFKITPSSGNLTLAGKLSIGQDPSSPDDVGDRGYNDTRYINVGEAINGDDITDGTIDSTEIEDNTVSSADILNNTVTETDISDSFVARDSSLLDGIDSTRILTQKSDIGGGVNLNTYTITGLYHQNTNANASSGTNYPVALAGMLEVVKDGAMVYQKYSTYDNAHNVYVRTYYNGTWYAWKKLFYSGDSGDQIQDNTIDSSEIQDNTLTASDLAPNSVGNSQLIDQPTVTQLNITAGNDNGIKFWGSNSYEIAMGDTANYRYGPVTNYSIKMNMSNSAGRGWTWGRAGFVPLTALAATTGNFQTAGSVRAEGGFNVDGTTVIDGSAWLIGDRIQQGSIDGSEIQDNTLTAADIAADAIGASELGNNSVASANIIDSTITTNDILNNTITTNDILNNTITETDISDSFVARNSQLLDGIDSTSFVRDTGNETIAGIKTFSSPIIGQTPTAGNHLTTKNYVDTLVTQGVTWKGPVETGNTVVGTWGACDGAKESWTTYNKNDDIIYICDGSAWISIGSSASVPYATTSSAGKIQIAGDLQGTWNNITIKDGVIDSAAITNNTIVAADIAADAVGASELGNNSVASANIIDNTITETDISDAFVARNSDLLDGLNHTDFVRNISGNSDDYDTLSTSGIYRKWGGANGPWGGSHTTMINLQGPNYGGQLAFNASQATPKISFRTSGTSFSSWNELFHTGNDGAGSGIDADLLDGIDSVNFLRSNVADTFNGTLTAGNYGVGNQIFSFGAANKGIKYITDEEGISIGTDSSMLIHAGDHVDTLTSELGIVAGTTSENLYLTADSNVDIYSNRQGGSGGKYLFRFGLNGNTSLPGNLTLGGTLGGDSITDGTIDGSEIQDNTLTAADIATDAVGALELAPNSVTASEIATNAVGNAEMIDNATFTNLTVTGDNGFKWENGINSITHNDGGGNVQIRFGHDYSSSDERFTHGGSAFYIGGNLDDTVAGSANLDFKVSSNGGLGNDSAVTWGKVFRVGDNELTWDGNNILTDASNVDADTLDGIDSTGFIQVNTSGDQIQDNTIDSSEIQDNTIAAADIAPDAIGSSELSGTLTYTDNVGNINSRSIIIDHNASGSDVLTADKAHAAIRIDLDSSATGGDTANEHRVYGTEIDIDVSGDSNLVYGGYYHTNTTHSSGQISLQKGVYGYASSNGSATVSNLYGGHFAATDSSNGTVGSVYGLYSKSLKDIGSTNTTATVNGTYSEIEIDAGTITNAYATRSVIDRDGGTINNGYLFYGDYQGTQPTNAYGVYIQDTVDNYFAGNVGIGTIPTAQLDIGGSDTATIRFRNTADSDHASLGISNGGLAISGLSSHVGNEHIYVANTGNVGIGTIDPTQKLEVGGNARVNGNLYINSTDTRLFRASANVLATDDTVELQGVSTTLRFNDTTSGHSPYLMHTNDSRLYIMHDANENLTWDDGEEDRVVMYSPGNGVRLGVGANSPAYELQVGANDVAGQKTVWVSGGATNEGGELRLATAANSDTTYDYYFMDAYQDDLRIGRAGVGSDFVLKDNGEIGIGTTDPDARIHINDSTDASLTSNGHGLQVGSTTVENIAIDGNEIVARNNGAASQLNLNITGGDVRIGTDVEVRTGKIDNVTCIGNCF